jgi:hypothetical protein
MQLAQLTASITKRYWTCKAVQQLNSDETKIVHLFYNHSQISGILNPVAKRVTYFPKI